MLFEPTKLGLDIKISAAFLTIHGSYFRADNGTSFVMGYNYFAEMCTESQEGITVPTEIAITNIVKVSAGVTHVIILTKEGAVFGCGKNQHSVFGVYGTAAIHPFLIDTGVSDVAATEAGSLIVKSGKLLRTGYSGYGELGFQGQVYEFEDT